jgi:transposase
VNLTALRRKYRAVRPVLTERSRRIWAASEAIALGHGGIRLVERATGISRSTISRGIHELDAGESLSPDRDRRPGGGRQRAEEKDRTLIADLDRLVEPTTSGDPDSPLRWTSKSVRRLARELKDNGHEVSYRLVGTLLHEAGYSLQANRKTREGTQHRNSPEQELRIESASLAELPGYRTAPVWLPCRIGHPRGDGLPSSSTTPKADLSAVESRKDQ